MPPSPCPVITLSAIGRRLAQGDGGRGARCQHGCLHVRAADERGDDGRRKAPFLGKGEPCPLREKMDQQHSLQAVLTMA